MNGKHLALVGLTLFVANLVGVLLFFKPVSEGDQSLLTLHPALGLLLYVGLSVWLYAWLARQLGNPIKGAFAMAAPQAILVIDLASRGERGWITAGAGCALLAVTWSLVAIVSSKFAPQNPGGGT